jgi:glycosyltransferase involved in cell wall biosynthesis
MVNEFDPRRRLASLNLDTMQVVIPALNEANSIGSVVERLQAQGLKFIRVVDNGSTDGTGETAERAGAVVLLEPRRGYGQACWTGMQDLGVTTRWVLFCDADGCDDIEALPAFFDAARSGAELVIGNRLSDKNCQRHLTPPQRFGNRLSATLIRLVSRDLLHRMDMADRGFGWTVEMQIRAARLGAACAEVPVRYHARRHGKSKISGTVRGVLMAGTIILGTIGRFALADALIRATALAQKAEAALRKS